MTDKIFTLIKPARAEIIVKKSRFIASAFPTKDEDEAVILINQVKKEHAQANHNVFAYIINEQIQRYSDDGEPSGTAGKPVLDVIKRKGLSKTTLVVTRYFGGILLGAGGLVHAYTEAAIKGIEVAGIAEKALYQQLTITIDYQWLGQVKYELENVSGRKTKLHYDQRVNIEVFLLPEVIDIVKKRLTDITAAQINLEKGEYCYL